MKFTRIIAVITALSFILMVCCLTVSADYSIERQVREEQLKLLDKYCNNKISYDEYISNSNELTMKLYDETTATGYISAEAEKIGNMFKGISNKIGATAQIYGDAAYQYVGEWLYDIFYDYKEEEASSTTDLLGYGAMLERKNVIGSDGDKTYCEYIELRLRDDGAYDIYLPGPRRVISDYYGGNDKIVTGSYIVTYNPENHKLYGDIRYEDGSQAPTDDEYETDSILKLDDLTDSELDKILQDILEELERQDPDLSTVEGLLESIYYRLGQLDSDNDNEVIAQLNAAIISLANSNNANTSQLILKLDELKKAITGEETGDEETDNNTEEPVDLTEIVKELKEISATVKGLAAIEVAENIWELTEGEQQVFNEYAALIPLIVEKLGLGFVQASMSDIESLIFTSSAPEDLTVNIYGSEYAILSRSMFEGEAMRYVELAKSFITVLLIYGWCMSMRKRLSGGEI